MEKTLKTIKPLTLVSASSAFPALSRSFDPKPSSTAKILETIPRWQWRRYAAKAFIASTTPATRFLLLRAGFVPFQTTAGVFFKEMAGFTFDSSELRRIYETIQRHVGRKERHLQRGFEELYQVQLHKDVVREAPEEVITGDDMRVEYIKDGSLKDVLAADLKPNGEFKR